MSEKPNAQHQSNVKLFEPRILNLPVNSKTPPKPCQFLKVKFDAAEKAEKDGTRSYR